MDDSIFIEVQRLCQLAHQRGLRELALSRPDFSVSLTTLRGGKATAMEAHPVLPAAVAPAPAPAPPAEASKGPEGYAIISPLVGIFYHSSAPGAEPFISVGDEVEVGQTIGIVEAMKIFNEITTDRAGVVLALPAEDGKLVQVGQPLVVINPEP
ncbi:MAG: acetyl-CoA carboxylase biotin carboxyl carrier protein [Armatimonadota bacterium]